MRIEPERLRCGFQTVLGRACGRTAPRPRGTKHGPPLYVNQRGEPLCSKHWGWGARDDDVRTRPSSMRADEPPLTTCREERCRQPTWSGRAEPDVNLRVCVYHVPWARRIPALFYGLPEWPDPVKKKPPRPLRCVHQSTLRDGDGRLVAGGVPCGKEAPRRHGGQTELPRHPNRNGKPLCEVHRRTAHDRWAHPEPEDGLVSTVTDEVHEERGPCSARLMGLVREVLAEARDSLC